MKKYKDGLAKYNAILNEYPDVKQALAPAAPVTAAVAKPVATKPAAPAQKAAELTLREIYETYHDAEETCSMGVIEKECTRCGQIKDTSPDEETRDIMEERIE
jgi:hypothetical protein